MILNHTTSLESLTPEDLINVGGFVEPVKSRNSKALCEAYAAATKAGDLSLRPCELAKKYGLNKKTASRWINGHLPRSWKTYLISIDPESTVHNVAETALCHGVHPSAVRMAFKWRGIPLSKKVDSKSLCELYAKIKAAGDLSLRPCQLEAKYDLCKATACRWAAGDLPKAWKTYLIVQDKTLSADNVPAMMQKHDAARSTVKKALNWAGIEFTPRAPRRPKEKKNPLSDLLNGWGR